MYINHLRNLLLSITAFTAVAVMFFASTENVYSQNPCPQGYGTPITSVIYLCEGACPIEVTWCCGQGISSPYPRIFIHDIEFLQNPIACPCVGMISRPYPLSAYPSIPIGEFLGELIHSGAPCFQEYILDIPPCDTLPQLFQIQVSNGGCYDYITTYDIWDFVPCSNPQITECHLNYTICIEYVNGQWKTKVTPSYPRLPTFTCENPDCFGMCDVFTD